MPHLSDAPRDGQRFRHLQLWIDLALVLAAAGLLVWRGPEPPSSSRLPTINDLLGAAVLVSGIHLALGVWRLVQSRRAPIPPPDV